MCFMAVALTGGRYHGRADDQAKANPCSWATMHGLELCLDLEAWPGTDRSSLSNLCQ